MSNRLENQWRLPLIDDPFTAVRSAQIVGDSRARAERALDLGEALGSVVAGVFGCFAGLSRLVRNAADLRDANLAALGPSRLDTANIPNSYVRSRLADIG